MNSKSLQQSNQSQSSYEEQTILSSSKIPEHIQDLTQPDLTIGPIRHSSDQFQEDNQKPYQNATQFEQFTQAQPNAKLDNEAPQELDDSFEKIGNLVIKNVNH